MESAVLVSIAAAVAAFENALFREEMRRSRLAYWSVWLLSGATFGIVYVIGLLLHGLSFGSSVVCLSIGVGQGIVVGVHVTILRVNAEQAQAALVGDAA